MSSVPWHLGDPLKEQRELADGKARVDFSDRDVLRITGDDRLSWLHSLTTAELLSLRPGDSALALILSPHGHVEFELHVIADADCLWIITEPGAGESLRTYLDSMRFMMRVEVADVSNDYGVVWEPVRESDPTAPTWHVPVDFAGLGFTESGVARGGDASKYVPRREHVFNGREVIVPKADVEQRLGDVRAGQWAVEALRVAAGVPRIGHETDHRTLPHEVGWMGAAVHVDKGCYRGQEAVARVHNLGHPPRRLVVLHLDGSDNALPRHGDEVTIDGVVVGTIGTAVHHYELGPIATAIVKRNTPTDTVFVVRATSQDGNVHDVTAEQEVIVVPL